MGVGVGIGVGVGVGVGPGVGVGHAGSAWRLIVGAVVGWPATTGKLPVVPLYPPGPQLGPCCAVMMSLPLLLLASTHHVTVGFVDETAGPLPFV